ncbi:nuclear transport factor 2 family protein [Streptomyces sp. 8L]|uniref:nuclear transport factor 2 family protein n=1 Tax=Streptomyces sp. 8L TaxID=2877242 RepID=UPI001CD51311|nr:nuclear transport factor 2 family protein [Streptomyces sp. 8L]MCA1216943.1 nuclear transport factor 2 family protein [Streptomyces sp. 8L]
MTASAGAAEQETVRIVEEREELLYEALAEPRGENLSARLGELLSERLVHIHHTGFADTGREYLLGRLSGVYRPGRVRRLNGGTAVHGDLAVTTGTVDVADPARGPAAVTRLEQTLVWGAEEGTWRLLLRQTTAARP